MKELDVAIKAAKESGKILMKYYKKNPNIYTKSDKTPVTIADKESEKRVVSIIKKFFPKHDFMGEEFRYDETDSDCVWIIDPLDGTRNFVRGMPFFGNCIALERYGKIIVSAIYMPAMKLLAYASHGHGAFVNNEKVEVSEISKIEDAFLIFPNVNAAEKKGYGRQFLKLANKCVNQRGYADTLGYILLAQGSADIVVDTGKPWDIAAAKIIIEEAGGRMTDFGGNDTIYSGNSIATNGKLHDEVVKIFNKK